MAKRIIWSQNALNDRLQILEYWFKKLGHKNFSRKLDKEFRTIIKLISIYPEMGRQLDELKDIRFLQKIAI